jgi:hypothetical protein
MISLAVQTLWTKPIGFDNHRKHTFFGFKTQEQFMASAYLSFEMLKRKGYRVHLYTDNYGKDLLSNKLGLKYDYVSTCHEELTLSPNLWAFCKLYTHIKQFEPYVHIDLDAYLFSDLDERLKRTGVIYQNIEKDNIFYKEIWSELRPHIHYNTTLSHMIRKLMDGDQSYAAMNVGIFGGSNLRKIKDYSNEAISFLTKNLPTMPEEHYYHFCTFVEQLYCYYYFYFHNVQSQPLDKSLTKTIEDFIDWNGYTHLIGDVKQFPDVVDKMVRISKENGFVGI